MDVYIIPANYDHCILELPQNTVKPILSNNVPIYSKYINFYTFSFLHRAFDSDKKASLSYVVSRCHKNYLYNSLIYDIIYLLH